MGKRFLNGIADLYNNASEDLSARIGLSFLSESNFVLNARRLKLLMNVVWVSLASLGAAGSTAHAQSALSAAEVNLMSGLRASTALQPVLVDTDRLPIYLEADQMVSQPDQSATLTGTASARRADTVVQGQRLHFDQTKNVVSVDGNARLVQDGNVVVGPSLRFDMSRDQGEVQQPNFWLENGGAGVGSLAEIHNRDFMTVHDMTYSGCPCPNPAWYIESSKLDLHYEDNEGVARNGVLYFKGVPILASPYLTFPIRAERKSGFLIPTFANTSRTGVEMLLPYYFNIAPNYDATMYFRPMTKRGLMLGGEFRYLQPDFHGEMAGTYLAHDIAADRRRWSYAWKHYQNLGAGAFARWDLNGVSDKDYLRDFTALEINQASTSYLPKTATLGWSNDYWYADATVAKYQTLADVTPQYNQLPRLTLNGARYNWHGFDVKTENTAIWFRRALGENGQSLGPEGSRMASYTTVAYPFVRPGWYITPKAGLHLSHYETDWQNPAGTLAGGPTAATRAVPLFSVDAGMTFERNTQFFGKGAIQTLEPRLYYLRVPYRDQSHLPVYDTSLSAFSFSQAFQENVYSGGWDRIANADQLTMALSTRWLDEETGFERASLGVAQRYYFTDQKVFLPGENIRAHSRSDFLFRASAALTDTLSAHTSLKYDPEESRWSRAQITARWLPKRATSLAVSYRFQDQPVGLYEPQGQNQISVSFQWPLTSNIYTVGRVDYSLLSDAKRDIAPRVTQAIAGFEYRGDCCWAARIVYQRYAVDPKSVNNAIFFQLELSGLGNLGQDPSGLLNSSIPHYQSVAPNIPGVGKFERYE